MRFPAQYAQNTLRPRVIGAERKTMENFALTIKKMEEVGSFCTMPATTEDAKTIIYNATTAPEFRLKDCINQEIELAHFAISMVEVTNKETGEVQNAPHITLIDSKGNGYACTSVGVFNALRNIVQAFGMPDTWEHPRKFRVKQVNKSADVSFLTLQAVIEK